METPQRFKQTLNLFDATALAIGAIVGAGIFVISGVATGLAGPAVILSIIIAGAISSFTAFSYTRLASQFPEEGGIYAFAKRTISPFSGFITGWLWIFENMVAGATVSIGFASYVAILVPNIPFIPVAVASILVLTAINLVGVKQSSIFNAMLVLLKMSALFLFVIIGFFRLDLSLYQPFFPEGVRGVLNGAALIFFAFIGFGRPTTAAEEIRDPERTIPRSIVISLALSMLVYVLVGVVSVGLIPYQELAASGSPLADAAEYGIRIHMLRLFISFAAVVATVSVLLTTLIGVSRVSYAMARDGDLPRFLSRLHGKFYTPYLSILITGIITAILPIFGSLRQTASVTNFGSLVVYAMVNLSAIMLFRNRGQKGVTKNLHLAISFTGLFSCTSLLFFLDRGAWFIGIAWIMVGVLYYHLRNR